MSTIQNLAKLISTNLKSKRDIWQHYLSNITNFNSEINAVVESVTIDEIQHIPSEGILNGIPIIYKDNICTDQLHTRCASSMLKDYRSPFNATVVTRMQNRGAVLLAKSNMDEFAMGSTTTPEMYGPCRNPWNLSSGVGGSSGGSAAAVSARMAPIAFGSDTGGSVRLPTYFCGVMGIKPTYGTISRYGLISYASSLDQIGVMGLSARDIATVLDTVGGEDEKDQTTFALPANFFSHQIDDLTKGTVGIDPSWFAKDRDKAAQYIMRYLQHAGYTVKEVKSPVMDFALECYYIISCSEAASNLARFDGIRYGGENIDIEKLSLDEFYCRQRSRGFGENVKSRIAAGTFFTSPHQMEHYYVAAQKYRRAMYNAYESFFAQQEIDALVMPVYVGEDILPDTDKGRDNTLYERDRFNVIANLLGYPSIAVPTHLYSSHPVGAQIMGKAMADPLLLQMASKLQNYSEVLNTYAPFGGKDLERL